MNGAALKAGLVRGGRAGAKKNLDWFWGQVGAVTDEALVGWLDAMAPSAPLLTQAMTYSPAFAAFDMATRLMSPYSSGHFYSNPLKSIVEAFEFECVCANEGPALYVCATNVRTGKIKLFSGADITGMP